MGDKIEISNLTVLKNAASYTMWAFQIKILFEAKDLMRYVDGTVTVNDVPPEQVDLWKERDAQAKMYILSTTDKTVKQHLLSCETSKAMYDKLKNIYEKDTEYQKCYLLQEMYSYRWAKSKTVLENVSVIRQHAYQLTSLGHVVNDTAVLTKIASILPKEYQAFATAWDSVPQGEKTLDNLCARLQMEESKMSNITEESGVAFNVKPPAHKRISCMKCKKTGHLAKDCRKCKFCGKTNHRERDCYFRPTCEHCKKRGHKVDDCFQKQRQGHKRKSNRDQNREHSNNDAKRARLENKGDDEKDKVCFMAYNKRGEPQQNSEDSQD